MLAEPVFESIQGEGNHVGYPVVFIRTSGCDLRCKWCDTKYSWGAGKEYILEDELKKFKNKHLVITGGEPLLWHNQFKKFLEDNPGYIVEFETNGTISSYMKEPQYNVSPKLSSSGNKDKLRLDILKDFLRFNSYFKFVIKNDRDWEEMQDIIKKVGIPKDQVYVMPEGVQDKLVKKHAKKYIKKIIENGYKLSMRTQIWLWGKKKQR